MKVLAVETATSWQSVAILDESRVLARHDQAVLPGLQAQRLVEPGNINRLPVHLDFDPGVGVGQLDLDGTIVRCHVAAAAPAASPMLLVDHAW